MARLAFMRHIGIDAQVDASGLRIWTSFSGTLSADDPYPDEVVIWSSLIEW